VAIKWRDCGRSSWLRLLIIDRNYKLLITDSNRLFLK